MTHSEALPQIAALDALDRAHLIHPVSPWRTHEARGPNILTAAQGIWLTDVEGRRFMDFHGNNVHHLGHGHPEVIAAIKRQLDELSWGFVRLPFLSY